MTGDGSRAGGTFFRTLVTRIRAPIFAANRPRALLHTALERCRHLHPFTLDAIVLLPDHRRRKRGRVRPPYALAGVVSFPSLTFGAKSGYDSPSVGGRSTAHPTHSPMLIQAVSELSQPRVVIAGVCLLIGAALGWLLWIAVARRAQARAGQRRAVAGRKEDERRRAQAEVATVLPPFACESARVARRLGIVTGHDPDWIKKLRDRIRAAVAKSPAAAANLVLIRQTVAASSPRLERIARFIQAIIAAIDGNIHGLTIMSHQGIHASQWSRFNSDIQLLMSKRKELSDAWDAFTEALADSAISAVVQVIEGRGFRPSDFAAQWPRLFNHDPLIRALGDWSCHPQLKDVFPDGGNP